MRPWSRKNPVAFSLALTTSCLALIGAVGCDDADPRGGGGDAGAPGADGGRGGSGAGAAAATPCGLAADHELVFALTDAGWARESEASGGRTRWRATLPVDGRTALIAPGQTVSVTVTFRPPLVIERDAGTAYLRLVPARGAGGDLHAAYQQDVSVDGSLTFGGAPGGDWTLDDAGRAASVVLTALAINPVAGETLSCLSSRVRFNPIGFSVSDNSAVDTQPGGTVAFEGVEIEVGDGAGELPLEPFAFTFGE